MTNVIFCFIQVSSTFDMIGYPTWVEDLETLDKYYENVSHFHETDQLGTFGFTCKSAPSLESLSKDCLVGIHIRAIYTGENKTRLMQDAPYIKRELYHLYVRVLHKTRTSRINGSRLIFDTASFT